MRRLSRFLTPLLLAATISPAAAQTARPVRVTVDAARSEGTLPPVWCFFGADEPNYATMKDGTKLLAGLVGGAFRVGSLSLDGLHMDPVQELPDVLSPQLLDRVPGTPVVPRPEGGDVFL